MRKIEIEAYADATLPEQGRVALLLVGVKAPLEPLARLPVVRLRPVDPSPADVEGQWPEGDLLPAELRVVEDGVELIIGADIAESPALLPGTAVEVEVPELRLRGECLWPRVALPARQRRRSIVAKRPTPAARAPQPGTRERPHSEPMPLPGTRERPHSEPMPLPNGTAMTGLRPDGRRSPPLFSGHAEAPTVQPRSVVQRPLSSRPGAETRQPTRGATHAPAPMTMDGDDEPSTLEWAPEPAVADQIAWQPEGARPMEKRRPATPPAVAAVQPPPARTPELPWSRRGLFAFIVGTLLAIEAVLFAVKSYLPTSAGADPSFSKAARTSFAAGGAEPRPFDVLQTPPSSPRGVASKETNPDKLLALANASLHAPEGARDVEEGAYWLKRYIAASFGEERMLRALTQLGTTYADPASGTAPDYGRSRQLWEFAAGFGDPVAMCFLGALHEHGLGVAAEKKAALHWYARAKSAGGCPQLEESIARVMP